jgi:hypothetical protein
MGVVSNYQRPGRVSSKVIKRSMVKVRIISRGCADLLHGGGSCPRGCMWKALCLQRPVIQGLVACAMFEITCWAISRIFKCASTIFDFALWYGRCQDNPEKQILYCAGQLPQHGATITRQSLRPDFVVCGTDGMSDRITTVRARGFESLFYVSLADEGRFQARAPKGSEPQRVEEWQL